MGKSGSPAWVLVLALATALVGCKSDRSVQVQATHGAPSAADYAGPAVSALPTAIPAPIVINDRQMIRQLEQVGGKLIDDGKAAAMSDLIAQLERQRCEVTLPRPGQRTMDGAELYAKCQPSVLIVAGVFKCDRCDNWHVAAASGFVISESGVAVTNHHVVNSPQRATLVAMTSDGKVYPVKEVLAASAIDDVAVIQLEGEGFKPLPISTEAPVGSDVYVISHPDQRFFTLSQGKVARYGTIQRERTATSMLEITADYARGSSGGPVLNSKGHVVGLVSSTVSVYYNTNNGVKDNLQMVFKQCVPAEKLLAIIDRK